MTIDDAEVYFKSKGYDVAETKYFSDRTLIIGVLKKTNFGIQVMTNSIHLYFEREEWVIKITPHGQEHIELRCCNYEEAITLAENQLNNF